MKVFYFLFDLSREDFDFLIERTWMVGQASDITMVIDTYYAKIGEQIQDRTKSTAFLEAMMFLEVFLAQGHGSVDDVEWVYDKNFLIFNGSLFEQIDCDYLRVDGDVLFATSRDSWKNPFFSQMGTFLGGQVRLVRPNLEWHDKQADKLNSIAKLWQLRATCIGDIVIPLLRNKHVDQIRVLLDFVKDHIGDQVVIKNNLGVEGKNVRALDLRRQGHIWADHAQQLKQQFFDVGVRGGNAPYFVRHYDIAKEFRVYFTHAPSGKITIYSVKNREITPKDGTTVFDKPDLSKENLTVVWHYQHPDDFCKIDAGAHDFCQTIIPLLGLNIGVLEICREGDGAIRFLEVNPLGGALMHRGPDEGLMRAYYTDMWTRLLPNP